MGRKRLAVVGLCLLLLAACGKEAEPSPTPRPDPLEVPDTSGLRTQQIMQRLYYGYDEVNWRTGWQSLTSEEQAETGVKSWKEWRLQNVSALEYFVWEHDYDMYQPMNLQERDEIILAMEGQIPEYLLEKLEVAIEPWSGREPLENPEQWAEERHDFVFTLSEYGDWMDLWGQMGQETKSMYDAANSTEFRAEVLEDIGGAMEHYGVGASRTMTRKAAIRIERLINIYIPPWVREVVSLNVVP